MTMTNRFNFGDYIRVTHDDGRILTGWPLQSMGITGYAQFTLRTRTGDVDLNANYCKTEVLVQKGLTEQEAQEQIHRLRTALLVTGLQEHFINSIQVGA